MTDTIDGDVAVSKADKSGSDAEAARPKITPEINSITTLDLTEALSAAMRDFLAVPVYGLFFGGFYAVGGWLLWWLLNSYNMPYLIYPLATGFALIAPFIAAGLYEVSRRREEGLDINPGVVFGSIFSKRAKELRWMALVTGFAFIIWIDIAIFLYVIFFGLNAINLVDLVGTIFGSPQGALFLVVGNLVGTGIGATIFAATVISFPMLLHKDVDFITAMITSTKSVIMNPKAMISWAIFIAFMLGVSLASFFIAIIVVLPLLGHASWHLYRRTISYPSDS